MENEEKAWENETKARTWKNEIRSKPFPGLGEAVDLRSELLFRTRGVNFTAPGDGLASTNVPDPKSEGTLRELRETYWLAPAVTRGVWRAAPQGGSLWGGALFFVVKIIRDKK